MGDGKNTMFWSDPWIHGCSLLEKFPRAKMRHNNIKKKATVNEVWKNNMWDLPEPAPENEEAWDYIKNNLSVKSNQQDSVNWKVVKGEKFFINKTWNILRIKHPELPIKRRLRTKDKLKAWGITTDDNCKICNNTENIEHCLFDCMCANKVWSRVLLICNCSIVFRSWRRLVSWFCRRARGNNMMAKLHILIITTTVYMIWNARNRLIFKNESSSPSQIIQRIKRVLIDKFCGQCCGYPEAFVTGDLQYLFWTISPLDWCVLSFCSEPEAFVAGDLQFLCWPLLFPFLGCAVLSLRLL
ncbi:uncharacterized protein LOC126661713 [Mercurialis annua]|uniref:uncharacterized protein LOC126661713 n=1 Tax=Mercurialis annua TaxID=3986 RepID=UPI00215DE10E|nr:uncharacterized protein LOC126661713 [Mercurialis annua]